MKIGELSKKSDLSVHTLRYYEKQGLITVSGRTQGNYRIYNQGDLETARFIKRCRDMGFSLDEVVVFLSIRADRPAHICADAKRLTQLKIVDVESKINDLQTMLQALHKLSDACCGGEESAEVCSIIDALDQ